MTPKAQATKANTDNWDLLKLKNFFAPKDTINRIRRPTVEWEKIFAIPFRSNFLLLPLAHCLSTTLASLLFLKHTKHTLALRPLSSGVSHFLQASAQTPSHWRGLPPITFHKTATLPLTSTVVPSSQFFMFLCSTSHHWPYCIFIIFAFSFPL